MDYDTDYSELLDFNDILINEKLENQNKIKKINLDKYEAYLINYP